MNFYLFRTLRAGWDFAFCCYRKDGRWGAAVPQKDFIIVFFKKIRWNWSISITRRRLSLCGQESQFTRQRCARHAPINNIFSCLEPLNELPLIKLTAIFPNENFAFRLRISRVFFKFDGGFIFLKNVKKNGANYELRFPPQLRRTKKTPFFQFLAIFDNNAGHRVTKFYPVSRINVTYKFYFMIFFSN